MNTALVAERTPFIATLRHFTDEERKYLRQQQFYGTETLISQIDAKIQKADEEVRIQNIVSGQETTIAHGFPLTMNSNLAPNWSPIDKLGALKPGFDGYSAQPPSWQTIKQANIVWRAIEKMTNRDTLMPRVEAGSEDFVEFAWYGENSKELHLWIYGNPTFFAEWTLGDAPFEAHDNKAVIKFLESYLISHAA